MAIHLCRNDHVPKASPVSGMRLSQAAWATGFCCSAPDSLAWASTTSAPTPAHLILTGSHLPAMSLAMRSVQANALELLSAGGQAVDLPSVSLHQAPASLVFCRLAYFCSVPGTEYIAPMPSHHLGLLAQVGRLWTSLADYYIRRGMYEKARDVYEEGLTTVVTVRDFSLIFDTLTQASLCCTHLHGPGPSQRERTCCMW